MDNERLLLVEELKKHINNSIIQQTTVFARRENEVCLCAINPTSSEKVYFKKYTNMSKYEILYSGYCWYTLPENEQLFNLAESRYNEQRNKRPEASLYDAENKIGLYKILLASNNKSNGR